MKPTMHLRRVADTFDGQPRYAVLMGEQILGHIEGHHPTFERRSPRKRYVNARWVSNRRYWRAINVVGATIARAIETRKKAMRYFEDPAP